MSSEKFKLSDQTFQVLLGNEQKIADEYLCDASYIYAIKNQYSNDPFPHFLKLFTASAKAGAPVCRWTNKLQAVVARYAPCAPQSDVNDCLISEILNGADVSAKLAKALLDGEFDEREIRDVEAAFDKAERNHELIREHFRFRRGVIEMEAESKGKINSQKEKNQNAKC